MEKNNINPNIESTFNWTAILKALADENRLQIIHELLKNEASVQDLSDILGLKIYNISKHLKILESNGLVKKRKDGNRRIYKVTDNIRSRLSEDNQVLDLGCCKFIFG
ncbi:MAG: winged helix-turn-helix transcriptional regulator [Nitrospiraceae bacterium]|nr:MAG: winged helix-turn-helix transcriptional regulator [Nitrospiraceae bacterium]